MSLYEDPAGTSWSGWEFAEHEEQVTVDPPTYMLIRDYSAAEANATNAANPLAFAESPVFRKTPPEMFTESIPATLRNELLAKGIPALSPAAGKAIVAPDTMANFNMNLAFKPQGVVWPSRGAPYERRWLHSDMKNMAYFYTWLLYKKMVYEGGLDE